MMNATNLEASLLEFRTSTEASHQKLLQAIQNKEEELVSREKELEARFKAKELQLKKKEKALEEREAKINSLVLRVRKDSEAAKHRIKLQVGDKIFTTTKETLCKFPDTYFSAMMSSSNWRPEGDAYFIDRNPILFSLILEGMRMGRLDLTELNEDQKKLMDQELDYFLLSDAFYPFNWSKERIGESLKVDAEKRIITAVGEDTKYRVGTSNRVFLNVQDAPDLFTFRVLHTGRSGINNNNAYMEVRNLLMIFFLIFFFC